MEREFFWLGNNESESFSRQSWSLSEHLANWVLGLTTAGTRCQQEAIKEDYLEKKQNDVAVTALPIACHRFARSHRKAMDGNRAVWSCGSSRPVSEPVSINSFLRKDSQSWPLMCTRVYTHIHRRRGRKAGRGAPCTHARTHATWWGRELGQSYSL